MKAAEFNLTEILNFDPENGRVSFGENRMLIFRREALATLRKLLQEQMGDQLARAMLSQFGFRNGMEDHKMLAKAFKWDPELDELVSNLRDAVASRR